MLVTLDATRYTYLYSCVFVKFWVYVYVQLIGGAALSAFAFLMFGANSTNKLLLIEHYAN